MEDRGIFSGRGFWALALLWLPAGIVAQALVRFLPETGPYAGAGLSPTMLPMLVGSLVVVAPLRPAAGARMPARVAARLPARGRVGLDRARRGHRGGVGGGRAARPGRDRGLCDSAQSAGVGNLVVAREARLTAEGGGPAAQQGGACAVPGGWVIPGPGSGFMPAARGVAPDGCAVA